MSFAGRKTRLKLPLQMRGGRCGGFKAPQRGEWANCRKGISPTTTRGIHHRRASLSLLCSSERLLYSTLLYSFNSSVLHTSTTWPRSSVLPSFARSALRCPLAAASRAPLPSRPSPHSLLLSQGNNSSGQPSLGTLYLGLPEWLPFTRPPRGRFYHLFLVSQSIATWLGTVLTTHTEKLQGTGEQLESSVTGSQANAYHQPTRPPLSLHQTRRTATTIGPLRGRITSRELQRGALLTLRTGPSVLH